MQQKLIRLYNECIKELNLIGIDLSNDDIGSIDIKITNRSNKRYGVCKHEMPDKDYLIRKRYGRRLVIRCEKFKVHHIEISNWVMNLDDKIIKNTVIHELIHCIPYCNNHGQEFKKYAYLVNQKLGYNISRTGNKEEDYKKSNIEYKENLNKYRYKIICLKCGKEYFRMRKPSSISKYRCGICNSKLKIYEKN